MEAVSRPAKLSHANTILYEIDMLEFCFKKLCDGKFEGEKEYFVYIEGFLLHYRNLIQFFGNKHDLKAGEPEIWSPRPLSQEETAAIQEEGPCRRYDGLISQYLSHCTKSRANRDVVWKHKEMFAMVAPLIESFKKLFTIVEAPPRLVVMPTDSVSTATITRHESLFESPIALKLPKGLKDGGKE